jgi:hypothetical protein
MTYRATILICVSLVASSGCRTGAVESVDAPTPAPSVATAIYVPSGTPLEVELSETLSTRDTRVGQSFTATLEQPVVTRDAAVVLPRGAVVTGRVTGLDRSDRLGDQAAIRLDFDHISFHGHRYPLSAVVTEARVEMADEGRGRDIAEKAAIGAAAGAALGAILTGDLKGMVTGAIIGAGAGTIISLGTGEVDAALPAGTDLMLRTTEPIRLR